MGIGKALKEKFKSKNSKSEYKYRPMPEDESTEDLNEKLNKNQMLNSIGLSMAQETIKFS